MASVLSGDAVPAAVDPPAVVSADAASVTDTTPEDRESTAQSVADALPARATKRQRRAAKKSRKAERGAEVKRQRMIEAARETEYYFENGLRKVRPYKFIYQAHAKGRWLGRELLDVFTREFRDLTPAYYKDAIESGRITVNGAPSKCDYVVCNNDLLGHALHRVEPPVVGGPIEIIERTDTMLVVNKPASIPVHPSGRYRHNSLLFILRQELSLPEMFPIHRLDRLTSGVLVIALDRSVSHALQREMLGGSLRKEYLCRVLGDFPDGEVECNEPILVFHHKLGLNVVDREGKACRTIFRKIASNGRTSLVHCRPLTGRTHQIRVHLQFLGYPIANDPLYAHPAWGPTRGKGGVDMDERARVLERFYASQQRGTYDSEARGDAAELPSSAREDAPPPERSSRGLAPPAFWASPVAAVSARPDPSPDRMCLWLHAHKYSGDEWTYEAPPPPWAKADFEGDKDIELTPVWLEDEIAAFLGDDGGDGADVD